MTRRDFLPLKCPIGIVPEVIPLRYDRSPTSCEASVSFRFLIPKWNTATCQQRDFLLPSRPHRRKMLSAQILPGLFRTIGPPSHGRPFLRPSGHFRRRDEESSCWCLWASVWACQAGRRAYHTDETRRSPESPLSAGQQKWAHVDSWAQRYILLVPNRCRVTTKLLTMFHQTSSSSSSRAASCQLRSSRRFFSRAALRSR